MAEVVEVVIKDVAVEGAIVEFVVTIMQRVLHEYGELHKSHLLTRW